jgi:hypothetical protein
MKKIIYLVIALIFAVSVASEAQYSVGTNNPNPQAALDLTATNKGVLIPRIALSAINNISPFTATPAISMLVYNTVNAGVAPNDVTPGYYYWDGTQWVRLLTSTPIPPVINNLINEPYITYSASANLQNEKVFQGGTATDFTSGASNVQVDVRYDNTSVGVNASNNLEVKDGGVSLLKISSSGAISGNVLTYNGTNLVWSTPSAGSISALTAGSGLQYNSGTTFDGTAAKTISIASGGVTPTMLSSSGATSGQVLTYNGTNVAWTTPSAGSEVDGVIGNEVVGSDSTLVRTHAGTSADPYKLEVNQAHNFNWTGTHEFDDAVFLHSSVTFAATGTSTTLADGNTVNINATNIIYVYDTGADNNVTNLTLQTANGVLGRFIIIINNGPGNAVVADGQGIPTGGGNYQISPDRAALFVFDGTVWIPVQQ